MNLLIFIILVWLGSAAAMLVTWLIAKKYQNISYVDVSWALLMALTAILAALMAPGDWLARLAVAAFGGVWGARLFLHLLHRVLSEPEDGRYQALRATWNGNQKYLFVFFQMQAIIVALFAIPFYAAASQAQIHSWQLFTALVIWLLAMLGEAIADQQLARWRNNPNNKGKTCRTGLWAWSRHPNYFFEWLHWFSYVVLAINSDMFMLSLLGPILMLAFLYRISGIPWVEAQAIRTRGADYLEYQKQVNAFFPYPPKKPHET